MLVGTDPRTAAGVVCLRAPVAGGSIIMGRRGHQRMVSPIDRVGMHAGWSASIGLHAWSITSITSINPRAADSVKNILQYRHI
eukprot:SAG25_NODE_1028_length_4237_cov_2.549058_1_plen_82_part_10